MERVYADEAVTLRPLRLDDEGAIFEAVSESIAEISPWMEWCHPGYRREETRQFLESVAAKVERREEASFAIVERTSGRLSGCCGLNQLNVQNRFANLGYWLRKSATGRGLATRATRLCALYGFEQLGLARVEIVVAVGNERSARVAVRAGAFREGTLRSRLQLGERRQDAVLYSLLPGDVPVLPA